MARQPVSGKPPNGTGFAPGVSGALQAMTAALSNLPATAPPIATAPISAYMPKTEGLQTDSLPKAKSVRLMLLLDKHDIHAEYDGFVMTFDSARGIRKLVSGQVQKPTVPEMMRFHEDVKEAAKKDAAVDDFMKANPVEIRHLTRNSALHAEIWKHAIDRDIFPNTHSLSGRYPGGSLPTYPTPYRGKVPLNKAQFPVPPEPLKAEQKPGPVRVIQLASSLAIEKDYGAYVVGYGSYNCFTKYNKATGRSVAASDAEIRVFQKDVKAAVEAKDAAVEAFVKDNPAVLKS